MKRNRIYLAVDLGAGSGRVLAGIYDGEKLSLEEINRFPCETIELADGLHWNFPGILSEIKKGIALAVRKYGDQIVSLGVDTWGVDYGLLNHSGDLLGLPFLYRDKRTEGLMEAAYQQMPKAEIYQRTGIQSLFFNTLYQLLAEMRSPRQDAVASTQLLFIPDLVNYFLTGQKVNERSIASTGQLLRAETGEWDGELLEKMGIPVELLGKLVAAGTEIAGLRPELAEELGHTNLRIIAVGSHDTASAVAGVPAREESPVFLSSGTWSLIGRELNHYVITDESFRAGFSNEVGVLGTIRFLKNISGMWLLQECKKCWDRQGLQLGFQELVDLAQKEPSTHIRINPDAEEFQSPCDMPFAIADYCLKSAQETPQGPGQMTRIILESLADKYAEAKQSLERVTGQPVKKIYVVGGGSQNAFLNQLTANATGCEIVAGPVEATSLGNILMQMISVGEINSLKEGREIVATSFAVQTFKPALDYSC